MRSSVIAKNEFRSDIRKRVSKASRLTVVRAFLYMSPSISILGVIFLLPLIQSIIMSNFKMDLLSPDDYGTFIGISNYIELIKDPEIWAILGNTFTYTITAVLLSFGFGLLTAIVLNRKFPGRTVARVIIISPWSVGYVVTGIVWRLIFDYQFGTLNKVLSSIGIIQNPIGWLTDPKIALWSIVLVTCWREFPFATLVILAGLQNIDPEQYDAGAVDGVNLWQRMTYITLPNIRQVNAIVLISLVISIFKRFGIIYSITGGGPAGATTTLIISAHFEAFKALRLGYASAISTVMLVFVLVFVVVYLSVKRKEMGKW